MAKTTATAEDLLEYAKANGYQTSVENGCVMLLVDTETYKKRSQIVKEVTQDLGFPATWGIRMIQPGKEVATT